MNRRRLKYYIGHKYKGFIITYSPENKAWTIQHCNAFARPIASSESLKEAKRFINNHSDYFRLG